MSFVHAAAISANGMTPRASRSGSRGWFTDGFKTRELTEQRALLDDLRV